MLCLSYIIKCCLVTIHKSASASATTNTHSEIVNKYVLWYNILLAACIVCYISPCAPRTASSRSSNPYMGSNWTSAEGDPGGGEAGGGRDGRDNTFKTTRFGSEASDDGGGLFIIMTRKWRALVSALRYVSVAILVNSMSDINVVFPLPHEPCRTTYLHSGISNFLCHFIRFLPLFCNVFSNKSTC